MSKIFWEKGFKKKIDKIPIKKKGSFRTDNRTDYFIQNYIKITTLYSEIYKQYET
mgnify:CR=1 FL=1